MAGECKSDGRTFGVVGTIALAVGGTLFGVTVSMGLSSPVRLAGFSFACLLLIIGSGASLWGLHLYLVERHVAQFRKEHRFLTPLTTSPHAENVSGSAERIVGDLWSQGVNVIMAYDWIVNALAYAFQTETFVDPDEGWGWMSEARFQAMAQWVMDAQATVRKVLGKKEADDLDSCVNRVREIEKGADPKGEIHEIVNMRGKAEDLVRWLQQCDDERRWPKSGPYAVKQ
jgi:hypothetical protein